MAILYQYNKKTGVTYVFEAQSYYVPDLHQSRKKKRLIGKLDPISGEVIPTGPRGRPRKKPLAPAEAQEAPEAQGEPELSELEAAKLRLAECAQTIDQLSKAVSDLKAENAEQKRTISDLTSKIERIQRVLNG